jgi:multidrug efflux system membrane fusion protein
MLKRRLQIALALTVVAGAVIWREADFASTPPVSAAREAPAVPVTTAAAVRQDVPALVQSLGTVTPIQTVSVQSRVSGQIMSVSFVQGQRVTQGQPLFLIDPRPYQAALDQANGQLAHDQAALDEARVDLTRYQTLEKENSISQQQAQDQVYVVQQDEGTVKLDQANVETATLNLAYCHIGAPAAGLTGQLLVDSGNYVQAGGGSTLVTITQIKPIYVSFAVPEEMLDEVRQYQTQSPLEVDAYSQAGKLLDKGTLTLINNQANTATGTVTLEATFDNPDESLWPGRYVNVSLVVTIRKNAVTVPAQTVMSGPSGAYVYVIGPDNVAKRVAVTVAARQNEIAIIAKGLAGGETVVSAGQSRLDDKVKVRIEAPNEAPDQQASRQ